MLVEKDNNKTSIVFEKKDEIKSLKRILQHAKHDIQSFNIGAIPHLGKDLLILEKIYENL